MRIDAHQHFWLYNPVRDAWIGDDMQTIRRNFLPNDISQTLKDNQIDGIIAVQADQSHHETHFLVELAQVYKVIKGVVGWVDLRAENIEEHLQGFSEIPIIKGFRHIIEAEADADFLSRAHFQRGIEALTTYGYTYDLLIGSQHYKSTLACVAANPQQKFMLDHMAKPPVKSGQFDEWAVFIRELAAFPEVYCKISGLVTEADWKNWKVGDFESCIAHAVDCFGTARICFGSDWPVSLLAARYEDCLQIAAAHLTDFTAQELRGFWGENATRFYGLK
ncbi:amidohydrolase family protein [Sphingobacterium sp. SGG-5]|uniref:amidohydrolase family protein n=1 Tax=Sphingobacterium sp. SGG-5 TaxID=2710881 RepID=UPI0013EC4E65|nr:amidohydrolase family protein [Sphingobacterium sp. SGG-5]NGM61895.1 amidohydrolase family protein [Sphingobacterium sp. SGG-5]